MARQHLSACAAALFLFAFVLPLAAARLGGRSCHTSFFFPGLHTNDLRILRAEDSTNDNGASAELKIFSIAAAKMHADGWIEHRRLPPSLVQVRLLNLRRQRLLNPSLPHALDLSSGWRHTSITEKPFLPEHPTHNEVVQTWTVSTSNPHQPVTWIDIHSRRGLWRHEFPDMAEQKPLRRDNDDAWHSTVNDLWRMAFGLLLGAASGMVFAATLAVIWSVLRRLCTRAHEEEDVGFLYGYQELLSPRSSEKEDVKGSEKEFSKENAGMIENK